MLWWIGNGWLVSLFWNWELVLSRRRVWCLWGEELWSTMVHELWRGEYTNEHWCSSTTSSMKISSFSSLFPIFISVTPSWISLFTLYTPLNICCSPYFYPILHSNSIIHNSTLFCFLLLLLFLLYPILSLFALLFKFIFRVFSFNKLLVL